MPSLDASFYYASALCRSAVLDDIQTLLMELAPNWSRSVRTAPVGGALDMTTPGALREGCCVAAGTRGAEYERLTNEHGLGPFQRQFGHVEIQSASSDLAVFASVDDYLLAPAPGGWRWGNSISLQVRGDRVGSTSAVAWLRNAFELICGRTRPVYGKAHTTDEWIAKNMDMRDGMRAIGTDLTSSLPGVYWMNYIHSAYLPLLEARLDSEHGIGISALSDGLMIMLSPDPTDWTSEVYRQSEEEIRRKLGQRLLFDRSSEKRQTIAPDFSRLFGGGRIRVGDIEVTLAQPVGP